jgi:hypothetical protein
MCFAISKRYYLIYTTQIIYWLLAGGIWFFYLLLVGVYSLVSYVVYSLRYSKMRKSMKAYYGNLKKLARIYEKEQ